MTEENINLENQFQDIFRTSVSGTGEEELLRIASKFSRQLSSKQIRAITFLEILGNIYQKSDWTLGDTLSYFSRRWLELKEFNNSALFVMRALEQISLRKFIGENTLKINVDK